MLSSSLGPIIESFHSMEYPISLPLLVAAVVLELVAALLYASSGNLQARSGEDGRRSWPAAAQVMCATGGVLMVGALATLDVSSPTAGGIGLMVAAIVLAALCPLAPMMWKNKRSQGAAKT